MEPRLLLSGTPVNLFVNGDADNSARDAVKSQLNVLFTKIESIGQQVKGSAPLTNAQMDQKAVLVEKSLKELFGTQAGDPALDFRQLGDYLQGKNASQTSNQYLAALADTFAVGVNAPDSQLLATNLQTRLRTLFGSQITVTDNSDGSQLHLDVDLSSVLKTGSTALNLGDTAKELTLGLGDTAQVNYTDNRVFRFSIEADLTGLADATTTIAPNKVLADFGSAGSANGIGFNAEVSHTTSNPLTFGLQVGLIGMQTTPGGAAGGQGGYANNATMSLNISSLLHFQDADQKLTVAELNTALPTFDVTFPAGQGNLSPTGLKVNETLLTMPFVVKNDATLPGGAANPGYIAGLSGVSGIIELRSFNVLDGHPALLGAGTDLNSSLFGRITSSDVLDMIDQTRNWAELFGESGVYSGQVPFLDSTLGSAYDFGTAFQKALSNQLSYSEQTLTGKDVPVLGGAGSFQIAVGSNTVQTISISAAESATYASLITNLNAKLNAAQSSLSLSERVQVRDTIQPSGAHVLEFFTTNAGAVDHSNPPDPLAFAVANFVNPGLFGLPTVNQLTLLPNGQLSGTGAAKYKLPEVAILSNAALTLAAFAGPVAFQISFTTAGVTTTKLITIEGRAYNGVDELAEQIQWKLFSAGILGGEGADKVNVLATDDGRLEFYAAGADSLSITYASGTSGDPLRLGGSTKTATASYLDFNVNGVTKRVYFNGNMTTGLVGASAESLQNFVDALHDMLVANGILDDTAGTGIDVQAMPSTNGSESIVFYARNPGAGTGKIASFSITGGTASLLTQLGFTQSAPMNANGMSVSGQSRHANFRTIQEFAERISNAGVIPGTGIVIKKANASFNNSNSGIDSKSFSFPLEFTLNNTNGLADKTINIKLDDAYGDLNGLQTTSTANLSRVTTSTLTFGIKLNPTVAPLEAPQAAMAIATKGWNGQLINDGLISIALDNGVFYNLSITVAETAGNDSVADFLDILQDKLDGSGLAGKVTAEIIHDDDSGYDILVFKTNTANTDSRLLIVQVPPQLQSDSTVANAAIGTLGLNTHATTSTGGVIVGSTNFGGPVTLPTTNVMMLISISDGSEGSINLAPFNYPANATTMTVDEYIAALNLAIGRSPGLMMSDYSAQKIVAYKAPGSGAGQFKIGFKINPDLVTSGTYTASSTFTIDLLDGTYAQPHDNGFADVDIGFTEMNVAQSPTPDLTVFSGHIADFTVPTANTPFGSFSVGGSSYAQVNLPQRTSTSRTAADLVADLNAAMATQDITFHLTGGTIVTAKLGDYISARLYAGTDQIQLLLTQPSGKPIATSFRFDPSDFAVTTYGLGNPAANGVSQERFVHAMGAEAFLTGVELVGKAHATANNVASAGNLGYFGFTSTNGTLDVQADTRSILLANTTQTRFTLLELGIAAAEDNMAAFVQNGKLTTLGTSHAILQFRNFTFNKDALTGQDMRGLDLAPKTGTAEVNYGTNFDITALPPSNEVYTGMLGFEKLSKLSLIDIFSGLLRSSEFIADVMALPGTAYELPLPFLNKLGLGDIINFGPTFQAAIVRALNTIAPTAQDLKKLLSQGLGIPAGDLDVAVATQFGLDTLTVANQGSGYTNPASVVVTISGGGGTGATATAIVSGGKIVGLNITNRGSGYTSPPTVTITGGGGSGATATATRSLVNASLDVTVDFTSDIADSTYDLPAYIDLNALGAGYWKGAPYVIQELAGLAAITATNPTLKQFNVDVTAASHLHLALGVRLVEDNATTSKPTPFLYNSTTIDTLFNIGGHTYNVEIPVGRVKLELDGGGSIGVNATGESTKPDAYGIEGIYNTDNMHAPVVLPDGSVRPGITTHDVNVRLVTNAPLSLQSTDTWVWNAQPKLVLNFVQSSEPGGVGTLLTSSTNVGLNDLRIQNITDLAVGQFLLINGQSDSPQNGLESVQNGLYQILDLGVSDTYDANGILLSVGHAFVLGRVKMSTAAGTPTMAQEVQALGEMRVHVQDGLYAGRVFQQIDSNVSIINQHAILFAKQIDPGQYHMTMGNLPTYDLPVPAEVATTTYLPGDYNLSNGTLTGSTNGSINAISLGGIVGIDGYKDLHVGDYVLVWNQQLGPLGTATSYQNGIYQITDLGSSTTKWSMQRPSWASTPEQLTQLRVSVQNGQTYGRDPHDATSMGTRFVQTQRSTLSVPISAGVTLTFSNDLATVYQDTSTSVPTKWFAITADGNANATLPFLLNGVQVSTVDGTTTGTLTAPLTISMTPKSYAGGPVRTGLDLYYDPAVLPVSDGTGSPSTTFNKVDFPDLPHWEIPLSNPLDMLKDPIAMADYLDLALFNLQMAIDQATGNIFPLIGSGLADYTSFVEDFRALLTDEVRAKINSNKDRPMTMIREAIFAILGNVGTGKGYLTSIEDVQVKVLNTAGQDLLWDFGGITTDLDQNETIVGGGGTSGTSYTIKDGKLREFVDANGTAASIEFSIHLSKQLPDVTMSAIDLNNSVPGLGVNVGNATGSYSASGVLTNLTGGINVKRNFSLDLTFGMNPIDGFYLKRKTGGNDMVLKIEATLDGDVNTAGVQNFANVAEVGSWNTFTAKFVDMLDTPGKNHSGFFGDFKFSFNPGSGTTNDRIVLSDFQNKRPLGTVAKNGLMDYTLDGDVDVHLAFTGRAPNVPGDVMGDLFISARYGAGLLAFTSLPSAFNTANETIKYNTLVPTATGEDYDLPTWRYDRTQVADGAFKVALANLSIDAAAYLNDSVIVSLKRFVDGYKPVKPFIEFLASPLPGLSSIGMNIVPIDVIASQFGSQGGKKGAAGAMAFVALFKTFVAFARGAEATVNGSPGTYYQQKYLETWQRPRASLGTISNLGAIGAIPVGDWGKYRLANPPPLVGLVESGLRALTDLILPDRNPKPTTTPAPTPEETRARSNALADALSQPATPSRLQQAQNYISSGLQSAVNAGRAVVDAGINAFEGKMKNHYEQKKQGQMSVNVGVSGGAFRYDMLFPENVSKLLLGQTANILFIETPRLEIAFAYSKFFPIPPVPVVGVTVNLNINVFVQFNFGWDNKGFYYSSVNAAGVAAPVFGMTVRLAAGIELDVFLLQVGIQAFLQVDVNFYWNIGRLAIKTGASPNAIMGGQGVGGWKVNGGTTGQQTGVTGETKLRGNQLDWLKDNHPGDIFKVTITFTLGVTLYVDLNLLFTSTRIVEFTVAAQWNVLIPGFQPTALLGDYDASTRILYLNMGYQNAQHNAESRLFADVSSINEIFVITSRGMGSAGENITITATLGGSTYTADYDNVQLVKGWAGHGTSTIDAHSLTSAIVNFYGGDGNSILLAGNGSLSTTSAAYAYAAAGSKNYLDGGQGISSLVGGTSPSELRGGRLNSTIVGGNANDIIYAGTGSDILVGSGAGSTFRFDDGFKHTRIYATGSNNSVDMSRVDSSMRFNLGRILNSVTTGNSFVFFTPTFANRITSWTGGNAGDRVTISFFPPNGDTTPLTFTSGTGVNNYAVYLGNATANLVTNPTANLGNINIVDLSGNRSAMVINTTRADPITFSRTEVTNGRERMTMSGLGSVILNAGDNVVLLGSTTRAWTDLGTNVVLNAGTFILVGNIEAENLTLSAVNSFALTKSINVRNNSDFHLSLVGRSPVDTANLFFGSLDGLTTPRITSSISGALASTVMGDGSGKIYIDLPNGSMLNQSLLKKGLIQAAGGTLFFRVRDNFGQEGNPIELDIPRVAGKSTGDAGGIVIHSVRDLEIIQATTQDAAMWTSINGLSTNNGVIDISMAAGKALNVGFLKVGGGKDIRIATDKLTVASGYYYYTSTYVPFTYTYSFSIFYGYTFTYTYSGVYEVLTRNGSSEVIQSDATGTSNLVIQNVTDGREIQVGEVTNDASTLMITDAMLDAVQTGFASITVGRPKGYVDPVTQLSTTTGKVTVGNYAHQQTLKVYGNEIAVRSSTATAALSSTRTLEFHAYKTGTSTGNITLNGGAGNAGRTISAASIFMFAEGDLTTHRALESRFGGAPADNGIIQLVAGDVTSGGNGIGTLTINEDVRSEGANNQIYLTAGANSGDIVVADGVTVKATDLLTIRALGGQFGTGPDTVVQAKRLDIQTLKGFDIEKGTFEEVTAEVTSLLTADTLTIRNTGALLVHKAQTGAGAITITTTGTNADLYIETVTAGVNGDAAVTLSSTGMIQPGSVLTLPNAYNVKGGSLDATAAGDIDLRVNVSTLSAKSTVQGHVIIDTLERPVTLDEIRTKDGLIQITAMQIGQSIYAKNVVSETAKGANTISITTGPATGRGDITVGTINAGLNSLDPTYVYLTSDGRVLKDSSGGLVTADNLLVQVFGSAIAPEPRVIDLNTRVNFLTVSNVNAVGDYEINEAGSITLVDVKTFTGGNIKVTAVDDITAKVVQAADATVTFDAGGSILNGGGPADIIFANVLLAKAGGGIDVVTTVDTIDAESTVLGDIKIRETDNALLRKITTNDGDIDIMTGLRTTLGQIVTTGNATIGIITAGTLGNRGDILLTAVGTALMDPNTPNALITGNKLTARSILEMDLDVAVAELDAEAIDQGNITIREQGSLSKNRIVAYAGNIDLTATGSIVSQLIDAQGNAGNVTSTVKVNSDFGDIDFEGPVSAIVSVDVTAANGTITVRDAITVTNPNLQAPADFISLYGGRIDVTSTGSLTTNTVESNINLTALTNGINVAGNIDSAGDLTLLAYGGDITLTGQLESSNDIVYNALQGKIAQTAGLTLSETLTADARDSIELLTKVRLMNVESHVSGNIFIKEVDDVLLKKVISANGDIRIITGSPADAGTLAVPGNAVVGIITAGSAGARRDIFITAENGIFMDEDVLPHMITGRALKTQSVSFIDIDTTVDTIDTYISGVGRALIRETDSLSGAWIYTHAGGVDLRAGGSIVANELHTQGGGFSGDILLTAVAGSIDLTGHAVIDGNVLFNAQGSVSANYINTTYGAGSRDITLLAQTGNIRVGQIGTGGYAGGNSAPSIGLATLTAGGAITGFGGGLVAADTATLRAQTGISNIKLITRQASATTGSGGIQMQTQTTHDTTLTEVSAGSGNVTVRQTGGGNLIVQRATASRGNLNLSVGNGSKLVLSQSFSGGSTTLQADQMSFPGGSSSIRGNGVLSLRPDSSGSSVSFSGDVNTFEGFTSTDLANFGFDLVDITGVNGLGGLYFGLNPSQLAEQGILDYYADDSDASDDGSLTQLFSFHSSSYSPEDEQDSHSSTAVLSNAIERALQMTEVDYDFDESALESTEQQPPAQQQQQAPEGGVPTPGAPLPAIIPPAALNEGLQGAKHAKQAVLTGSALDFAARRIFQS